jgi:hypothetical protein
MTIYPNKKAALEAIKEYRDTVNDLSERLGVYEECEDSCCAVYASVQFYAGDGKTVCKFSE